MAIIRYKNEELFPVMIYVLAFCTNFISTVMMKYLVKDYYPDLRGKVDTDLLCASAFDLLNEMEDPFMVLLSHMYQDFQSTTSSIENLYPDWSGERAFYEYVDTLANDFYWSIIIDQFPCDDEFDDYLDSSYDHHLDLYVTSLIILIERIIITIDTQELDLDNIYEGYHFYLFLELEDFKDRPHAAAFEQLFHLLEQLYEYQKRIENKNYDFAEE